MIILFFYQSQWGICATIPCGSGRRGRCGCPVDTSAEAEAPTEPTGENVPYGDFARF